MNQHLDGSPTASECICRMVADTPHAYPTVTWDPACPMHGAHAQTSMQRLAIERWKERGRALNALYAVLSPATEEYTTHDPVEDLQNLVGERDRLIARLADAEGQRDEFADLVRSAIHLMSHPGRIFAWRRLAMERLTSLRDHNQREADHAG